MYYTDEIRRPESADLKPQEEEEAEVVDLMAALRESVARTKRQQRGRRKPAGRKAAGRPARKAS